jgi:signal transduction histidine kinase
MAKVSGDFLDTGPRLGGPELRPWIIETSIIALLILVAVINLLAGVFAVDWAVQTNFPVRDFLVSYVLPFTLGLIYLAMGAWVFKLKGKQLAGQVFALFCAFFALVAGLYFDLNTTHRLAWLWAAALPLTAAALIHLALVFPEETPLVRRQPLLKVASYAIALPIAIWNEIAIFSQAYPRAYSAPWLVSFIYIGLSVFIFIGLLLYTRRSATSGEIRQQASILLLGSILAAGPILFYLIPLMLTGSAYFHVALLFPPFAIFPAATVYAILRYRLLNVDLVISQGLVYSVLTLLVTAVYFLLLSSAGILLQIAVSPNNPIALALFILLLVVFLIPVKERVQRVVDRFFYRERFDYRLLLQGYGRTLSAARLDLTRILELLVQRVQDSLQPERTVVFLYDHDLDTYVIRSQSGAPFSQGVQIYFAHDSELVAWLVNRDDVLYLDSEDQAPAGVKLALEEQARLAVLGIVLCVPLGSKERLVGWLALGPKRSKEVYSADDLVFLNTLSGQTAIAIENAQLLEEAQRRAQGLSALQETFFDIASQLEISQLLQAAVERAAKLLQAKGGALYLCDPQRQTLHIEINYNLDPGHIEREMAYGEGVAGRVAVQGEPLTIPDYRLQSGSSRQYSDAPFGAVIGVPLKWGPSGEVRGVLIVLHERGLAVFSDEDTWLLSLFADQVSIVLENARLYQHAREQARQLSTINEVGRTIASARDLSEILNLVMSKAVEILGAEAGSLLLLEGGEELVFQVALGPTGDQLVGMRLPIGQGLVGAVAQEGEPIIVNDVKSDPRWSVAVDESTSFVTRSILAVPLASRDRVIGVIELINKRDGSGFDQDDSNLLASFASQVAVTIENAMINSQLQGELDRRAQEGAEFLSLVAHELRIPMTSIKGYAKLLDMGVAGGVSEKGKDFLNIISKNVERMDRLVQDLLDISRIETGRLRMEMAPVAIQAVVEEAVQELQEEIDRRQLTLAVSIPEDLPPAWGDSGHISRIFSKLLTNACSYTPPGGRVQIKSTFDGEIQVSINDTGVGIAEEDRDKIFTPFFRADDPLVRDYPGNGLGLAVVKGLVEKHGGRIWFESEPGVGTTFTFTLPVASSPDDPLT